MNTLILKLNKLLQIRDDQEKKDEAYFFVR